MKEEYCPNCGHELHHHDDSKMAVEKRCPHCGRVLHHSGDNSAMDKHCAHCGHDLHHHGHHAHRGEPHLPMEPMQKHCVMSREVKIGIIVISAIFAATAIDILARKYLE